MCVPYVKPVFHHIPFVSERKRQVVIKQTRFLSTVILHNKFKSENIYSGVNFCEKYVCGKFYLWEPILADRWRNCKNNTQITQLIRTTH